MTRYQSSVRSINRVWYTSKKLVKTSNLVTTLSFRCLKPSHKTNVDGYLRVYDPFSTKLQYPFWESDTRSECTFVKDLLHDAEIWVCLCLRIIFSRVPVANLFNTLPVRRSAFGNPSFVSVFSFYKTILLNLLKANYKLDQMNTAADKRCSHLYTDPRWVSGSENHFCCTEI